MCIRDSRLGTQMKATGEVMGVGRTIEESLLKAIRSLEIGVNHLHMAKFDGQSQEELMEYIPKGTDDRIYAIAELLRLGCASEKIAEATKIDVFFIRKLQNIIFCLLYTSSPCTFWGFGLCEICYVRRPRKENQYLWQRKISSAPCF